MFNYLRYAAQKQNLLRSALIDTVEARNKQKAEVFLNFWREATETKLVMKDSLV